MTGELAARTRRIPETGELAAPALYQAFDAILERHGGEADRAELEAARHEYQDRRGQVFEDDELWEAWAQAFLEWYALERPYRGGPSAGRQVASVEGDPLRRAALVAWCASQRCLVEIQGFAAGAVELVDLIGGAEFRVREERVMHGVSIGDAAEVRLVGWNDEVRFGRTFLYHPSGALPAIRETITRLRGEGVARAAILDRLATLRLRAERYRHVEPARVYRAATETLGAGELAVKARR